MLIGEQLTPGCAVSGTGTLLAEMVRQLESRGFDLTVLNLSRPLNERGTGDNSNGTLFYAALPLRKRILMSIAWVAQVAWGTMKQIRRSEGVVLITDLTVLYTILTIAVWLISKAGRRPLALWFVGGFLPSSRRYGSLSLWLAKRTFLRCSAVYAETPQTHRDLGGSPGIRWLPNTRDIAAPPEKRRGEVRKLLFAARLRMDKGLVEALEACRSLPEGCHLDVFGPVMRDTDLSLFEGHPRASYGGELEPEELIRALPEYDLLLFPSYYKGEGFPGSVLEVFQCGLPVIATNWGSIPDLVRHEVNGLLVEPRSADSLKAAILRLLDDPELYRRLCEGAREQGEVFRSGRWYDEVARDLRALCVS